MAKLVGHVATGLGFFLIGIWHLFNHIKLHTLHPNGYTSFLWFPTPKIRHLELFLIMVFTLIFLLRELFSGHHLLNSDGSLPSNHLHYLEHSCISLSLFIYSFFSLIIDKITPTPSSQNGITNFLASIAFGQELLLFHLHSTDHNGVEGQYHWLLQIAIFVSLATTLLAIPFPNNFLNNFVRSYSIMFQGIWLMVIGLMLWTPKFIPKDCYIKLEEGYQVVRCHDHKSLERAKALVNIEFSWYIIGTTAFVVSFYLVIIKIFTKKVEYQSLKNNYEDQEEDLEDVEIQKRNDGELKKFVEMGKIICKK
ncbi:uncharacterized protein LOC107775176 [Nicotiana tabacum]|uniref:Uncharacterized protein LOC107775176 n=2 Tax=Nicotiana TaxID=4085 RepID=A0A1S3YDZ4_TOBAC|nr:PREDICTED: uncharacterized protein LOC104248713 [Nicotiana sylvestris]XP_016450359.1 PREDICTED: uncharacterized protein LOC107775176 [Nicotiana tabacum]